MHHVRFAALTDGGRDGVDFLRGMDPLFTLRFPDGSTVDVVLSGLAEDGTVMLTEADVSGLSRVNAR